MYPQSSFEQKYEKYYNFSSENYHFYGRKNRSLLHGCVFVMNIKIVPLFDQAGLYLNCLEALTSRLRSIKHVSIL